MFNHLTTTPGEEWLCGPQGTHHHFKTHQRLGTKEALAGDNKDCLLLHRGGGTFRTLLVVYSDYLRVR